MQPTRTRTGGIAERLSALGPLERPAQLLAERSERWRGNLAEIMRGRPLGHALHPALTDLPIGFWTSAVVLDVAGGKKRSAAAKRLIGLGILSAVPTAVSGFADVSSLEPAKRRVAVVHAASNSVALFLFMRSWWARARGHRGAGILDGLLASAVATLGGYLGGWMAFGEAPSASESESATSSDQPVSQLTPVTAHRRAT